MKKTMVITGGNKGLGADITRAFYDHGYYVLVGARTDNDFIKTLGDRARFFETDVKDPKALNALAQAAIAWTGQLNCFINNAGFSKWSSLKAAEESLWDDMIDTNLKGVFFGCKAAASKLSPQGSIINVSSLAGKRGTANNAIYCATKFGVNGITQALAKELGPEGIRVNAVCPVLIKTEGLLEALNDPFSPTQGSNAEDFFHHFSQTQSALKRLPTGKEVADCCLFLASEMASAITGQCINVDCGVLPQ